jgi:hypothetical protein
MSGRQGDCRDDGHYALSEQDAKLGTGKIWSREFALNERRYDSAQRLSPPYAMWTWTLNWDEINASIVVGSCPMSTVAAPHFIHLAQTEPQTGSLRSTEELLSYSFDSENPQLPIFITDLASFEISCRGIGRLSLLQAIEHGYDDA